MSPNRLVAAALLQTSTAGEGINPSPKPNPLRGSNFVPLNIFSRSVGDQHFCFCFVFQTNLGQQVPIGCLSPLVPVKRTSRHSGPAVVPVTQPAVSKH